MRIATLYPDTHTEDFRMCILLKFSDIIPANISVIAFLSLSEKQYTIQS